MDDGLRSILETKEFSEAKGKLLASLDEHKLFDELMFGIDYVLSRRPNIYGAVSNTNGVRLFTTKASEMLPSFTIWYRYDDEHINPSRPLNVKELYEIL